MGARTLPSPKRPRRHTVATVISHGVAPFEMAVPCEVFGIDRSELGVPWYRHRICAAEEQPLPSSQGFTIDTPVGLDQVVRADTVVVPRRWPPGTHRSTSTPTSSTSTRGT
jgi:transcriptional regulator GlxA family with amidase domain